MYNIQKRIGNRCNSFQLVLRLLTEAFSIIYKEVYIVKEE